MALLLVQIQWSAFWDSHSKIKMDKQKFCKNLSEWVQIPNNESCFVTIAWYPSGWRKWSRKMNHDRDFYSKIFVYSYNDIEGSNPSHASMWHLQQRKQEKQIYSKRKLGRRFPETKRLARTTIQCHELFKNEKHKTKHSKKVKQMKIISSIDKDAYSKY